MASMAAPPNIYDASAPVQEGQRATESNHRKIELQHPDDWTYLIANVTAAAREKIEKHFATLGEEDGKLRSGSDTSEHIEENRKMRERVEILVDEYIRATYNAAKPNVSINGMDAQEMEVELAKYQEGAELEPFNGKLAQRIQLLSAQVEEQTLSLANLRRKVPGDSAASFRKSFEARSEEFDQKEKTGEAAEVEAAKTVDVGGGGGGGGVVDGGLVDGERSEEMRLLFERGRDELGKLKLGLGGTVARMERAEKASGVVRER